MPNPPRRAAGALPPPGLATPQALAGDRQFAVALARGLALLRAFTPDTPLLGNRELAERSGLPKPTVSRLSYTLTLLGYLTHDRATQKYRLGPGVLALAHPLLAGMPVRQRARPVIEALARATGCTVNLGLRDRGQVVYIDSVRADAANRHLPDIGSSVPLLTSAIGRAILVACKPAAQQAILNFLKVQDPAGFAADEPLWRADRDAFAARGCCHASGQWRRGVHAVAVPIVDADGGEPLALACTLAARPGVDALLLETVRPALQRAAATLQARLAGP